tara:strand:- start:1820 stop:2341 length:522 start_codon:yes stop_codon:yes gene_type:complete
MREDLLDRLPDDIIIIIYSHIKPSIKYNLTKKYFNKLYFLRLGYINNKVRLYYIKSLSIYQCYVIKNLNYIKFLLKNDLLMMIKNIIEYKLTKDRSNYIIKKPIIYENMKFKNFIDLCYILSIKYKSNKILEFINIIINTNDVKISKRLNKYDNGNSNKRNKNIKNKKNVWIA